MKPHIGRGDDGQTDLIGGPRVDKDSARIDATGTVDELNCAIGLAAAGSPGEPLMSILAAIQQNLFVLGGDLAVAGDSASRGQLLPIITGDDVARSERWIEQLGAELSPLHSFILPGGSELSARLHLARAVCRRAERAVVRLARREPVNPAASAFLNRLSDLLFVSARWTNKQAGVADVPWLPRKKT